MAKQNNSANGRNASATAQVTFNRGALVQRLTVAFCDTILAHDLAKSEYDDAKVSRDASIIAAIKDTRDSCVSYGPKGTNYDASTYMGIITEVLGNGWNARKDGYIAGAVYDALRPTVTDPNSLSATLSKGRAVAFWYADLLVAIKDGEGLNTLAKKARDVLNPSKGTDKGATTGTAEVSPATIKATLAAWIKAGMAAEVAATFAAVLKASKDKALIEASAGLVDVADELKAATK